MNQTLFLDPPFRRSICRLLPLLLVLISNLMTYARPIRAQNVLDKEVTLTCPAQRLDQVLTQLETATGATFVFSPKLVGTDRIVSLSARQQKLSAVLNGLLNPLRIGYEPVGNQIVLKNRRTTGTITGATADDVAELPVRGIVKSKAGETLAGVNVLVKGSQRGAVTNAYGEFTINANTGDILVFSFVGFKPFEQHIGDTGNVLAIELAEATGLLAEVAVIGSRANTARTDVERPVPVDILTAKELQATGQTELGQQVQFVSPSFNSTKNGINGIANYADPASLKGLSPDQMLVLVDGKRYHQFAAVQGNVTVGKGTVVTDLNTIPALALERIEILRDGAAAQYGSDAIAGIVNLALKKSVGKGAASLQYGATSKGDGAGYTAGLNYGFALGQKGGYLNLTGSYQDVGGTNRSDPYNPQPIPGGAYAGLYTNVKATDEAALKANGYWGDGTYGSFRVGQYGSNAMKSGQVFYNAGLPVGREWTLYSFGGYSNKQVFAQAFVRTAVPGSATSNPDLYPNGYVPQLPGTSVDYSTVVGFRRKVGDGWNVDLSTGYGKNYLDQYAKNSSNASLGAASPRDFYVGRIGFGQSLTEVNLSKSFPNFAGTQSFNFAVGAQFRVDNFVLNAGDDAASTVGPLAASKNKTPGSQGRVGIDRADETDKSRSNLGLYVDVESDITSKFLVAAALRYENYSDFGSNFSGKLAARLKLTESISIRGSVNKGFRAPLLQQIANAATVSTVQSGIISSTKQLPSTDARLKQIGIEDPKPETSYNYNLGITAKAGNNFLFTVDAYQIDISDRIIVSENLKVAGIAALKVPFAGLQEITFFTNAIGTTTKGVDLVASYKTPLGPKSRFTASLALTVNKTEISSVKATPAALQQDTKAPVILIDTVSRSLIETSQPHTKILGSVGYQVGKFGFTLRGTYFGAVTSWEKLTAPVAGTTNLHRAQTFAGKMLFDASVVYTITRMLALTVGGNNLTDVYPDKVYSNYASYTNGQVPYTRNSNQFGFNGAYYYGSLALNF